MKRFTPWILTLVLLTGCAGGTAEFPSLAKRAVESRSDAPLSGPALPAPNTPIDGASLDKANAAVRSAREAESAFGAALAPARQAVSKAAGASFGTEAWIEAQMAVSALERARLPVKTALSDVDDLQGALISSNPAADTSALAAASRVIGDIDAEQARTVESLMAQLSSR